MENKINSSAWDLNNDKEVFVPNSLWKKEFKQATRDKFFIPNHFSKSYASPKYLQNTKVSQKYTPEQVKTLLQNPYKNYLKLQEISNYLYANSPIYQNYLYDMATTMTFDYLLYPDEFTGKEKDVTIRNRLLDSAKAVRNAQVKTNYPMMVLEALKNGEAYYYIQDEGNVIYDIIPSKICQLALIDDDNLWRYWVDLALIDSATYIILPEEIRLEYDYWIANGKNKKQVEKEYDGISYLVNDNYYLVSKKGNAIFCHMQKVANDYPYYASMFPDLIRLEENKTFFNEVLKDNNIKTIHLKVPLSSDGIPYMDKDTVGEFHDDAVRATGDNVSIITNPFEAEGISLDKSQQSGINLVEHTTEVVSTDSGISKSKYNAETTNGLKYSVNADAYRMFPLRYFFENIINYRLKKYKYKVTFLPIHRDNIMEWHDEYGKDLLSGGSRFAWLSTSGIEIYEYLRTLELERSFSIDELLVPKVSASNMSGEDQDSSTGGRPRVDDDNKADSTIKVDETS